MLMFILDYKVHSFWRGPESGRRGVEDWCSKVTSESCWKQGLADNLLLFFRVPRVMDGFVQIAMNNSVSFSFRHHTNPVGTEWRWKMDQPEMILQEAIENHQNMIKQFQGNLSYSCPLMILWEDNQQHHPQSLD